MPIRSLTYSLSDLIQLAKDDAAKEMGKGKSCTYSASVTVTKADQRDQRESDSVTIVVTQTEHRTFTGGKD